MCRHDPGDLCLDWRRLVGQLLRNFGIVLRPEAEFFGRILICLWDKTKLGPDASTEVIAQKLHQAQHPISIRSFERVNRRFWFAKKLYACRPKCAPQQIETQRTRRKQRAELCDPASLERQVRQLLADKIPATKSESGAWRLSIYAWANCSGGRLLTYDF